MDGFPAFVETFAALDRARLTRLDEATRSGQLAARQALQQYVEDLWHDVERSGERPEVGEKYRSLAVVRELTRSLASTAFEAVYDTPARPGPEPGA